MSTVKTSLAFSPCHITGFFQIHDRPKDVTRKGSTGAGVNLEQGVTTLVTLNRALRQRVSIEINGGRADNAFVSKRVVDRYLARDERIWKVQVNHECRLPIGRGYGTSGAAAVSLSLALNNAIGEPYDRKRALEVAHEAELRGRTGLGTVAAVSEGGLAVRVKAGSPGTGEVRRLTLPNSVRIVSGSFGPIPTASVLSSLRLGLRVNHCSRGLVGNLLRKPDERNFMRLSRKFAECLGLISSRLRRILDISDRQGFDTSMLMLGDGAFCIVPARAAREIVTLWRREGLLIVVSRVYSRGAALI